MLAVLGITVPESSVAPWQGFLQASLHLLGLSGRPEIPRRLCPPQGLELGAMGEDFSVQFSLGHLGVA